MRRLGPVSVGIAAVLLGLPVAASAGTVTRSTTAITYNADAATAADERVDVGIENNLAFLTSERGVTSSDCTQTDPNRVDCPLTPAFIINLLGFNDRVAAEKVTDGTTLEVHGNGGDDTVSGTPNNDRLFGDAGVDTLDGSGGNDLLDGGPGENYLYDGPGDDTVVGGPNQDSFHPGPGRDTYSGGDGNSDYIDYGPRTSPVTITLDGQPDDGEAGEGDNVGADIESAYGGSGNDRIVGGPNGNTLRGGPGNDSITGGSGEQRIEGNEGDDTIEARDGVFDSIDCGPGNDTVLADLGDSTTGCEIAPDRDGDGTANEADCAPDNATVHPGAGEIFGNAVDEDCKNGPGYFKVFAGYSFDIARRSRPARVRFTSLRLSGLRIGDRVEVRCTGRGCAFKKAIRNARAANLNITPLFKRRYLRAGTIVEIRVLRANHVGRVVRLRVTKTPRVTRSLSCLGVGATRPGVCPTEG